MSKDGNLEEFFDYGKIEISHRLNINKPVNHEKRIIEKGIRIALSKIRNCRGVKVWEWRILYRDENFKSRYISLDIDEYEIRIVHKGDMLIEL